MGRVFGSGIVAPLFLSDGTSLGSESLKDKDGFPRKVWQIALQTLES